MAMKRQVADAQRGSLLRIAGWSIAAALLLLPLIAMQFTPEVNWTASDFIIWGIMLGTVGGLFELAVGLSPLPSYRAGFALALVGTFLVTWVNLAVGIVGSDDNPSNQFFFLALLVGVVGAGLARLRAAGMTYAMFSTALALGIAFVLAEISPRDELWVPASRETMGTGILALIFVASALLFRRAAGYSSSSS